MLSRSRGVASGLPVARSATSRTTASSPTQAIRVTQLWVVIALREYRSFARPARRHPPRPPTKAAAEEATIMARARQKMFLVALATVTGWAGNAPAAAPPPKTVAAPFSPSGVLAKIGERKGNVSYAAFGQQRERPETDRSLAPYLTVLGAGGAEGTERVPL